MNEIQILQARLYNILDKPVYHGRLEEITNKQRSYLRLMCDIAEGKISETNWAYREDFKEVILNIVHPKKTKYISPKAEAYLKMKKIYD